jgi:glutaredoxin
MSSEQINDQIINKIIEADPDYYIIFYVPYCPYCKKALALLQEHNFKGYNIDNIPGGMETVLNALNSKAETIAFNPNHKTKPIIFYNHKFIGGYSELAAKLNK